jgi:hypothetical protein
MLPTSLRLAEKLSQFELAHKDKNLARSIQPM